MAVTIFEDLQDELGPDAVPDSLRRTLERRIAKWRALHGADKQVFFRSVTTPAVRRCPTSPPPIVFASPSPASIFRIASIISGWPAAAGACAGDPGGESFSAVAEGLQDALWKLGGVPREHRTDSLSAAFKTSTATRNSISPSVTRPCAGTTACRPPATIPAWPMRTAASRPPTPYQDPPRPEIAPARQSGFRQSRRLSRLRSRRLRASQRRRAKPVAAERETLNELPKRRTTDFAT